MEVHTAASLDQTILEATPVDQYVSLYVV
jgi:hypothetical protein